MVYQRALFLNLSGLFKAKSFGTVIFKFSYFPATYSGAALALHIIFQFEGREKIERWAQDGLLHRTKCLKNEQLTAHVLLAKWGERRTCFNKPEVMGSNPGETFCVHFCSAFCVDICISLNAQ